MSLRVRLGRKFNTLFLFLSLSSLVFVAGCSKKPSKLTIAGDPTSVKPDPTPESGDASSIDRGNTGDDSSTSVDKESEDDGDSNPSNTGSGSTPKPGPTSKPSPTTPSTTSDPGPVASATCYKGDDFSCAVEAAIVAEMNKLRTSPLPQSPEASFVARLWSSIQSKTGKISHDGFPNDRQSVLIKEFPSNKIRFHAENVAMTGGSSTDPLKLASTFVKMWYNSEGHRKNMLGNHKGVGVGVIVKGKNAYATQIFY